MIYRRQEEYYTAINISNSAGESTVFIEFMLSVIKASLLEIVQTSDDMSDGGESAGVRRRQVIEQFLTTNDCIKNADVRSICGVSAATANRILKQLMQDEVVEQYREKGQ